MRKLSRRAQRAISNREPTREREALERRWVDRIVDSPRFGSMVVAEGAAREPFHRWLHFKQGYSPSLVREFLRENRPPHGSNWSRAILDPFSGSGTGVIECAKANVAALGVEAIPSLAFLANCVFEKELPNLPELPEIDDWREIAPRLQHPLHRAALMLAVARQFTSSGKPNKGAKPLRQLLDDVLRIMGEDLRIPLPRRNVCNVGDARDVSSIDDETIGGTLTSPPYLSRHDYSRITRPYESVYSSWFGAESSAMNQIPAHERFVDRKPPPLAKGDKGGLTETSPYPLLGKEGGKPAAKPVASEAGAIAHRANAIARGVNAVASGECMQEIAECLQQAGEQKWIDVVNAYFRDMQRVLGECHRVLVEGGMCWMVVGGARVGDVYIPSDLIVAELAEACGLAVGEVRVARALVGSPRKFGSIGHVAPRESVLIMQCSA